MANSTSIRLTRNPILSWAIRWIEDYQEKSEKHAIYARTVNELSSLSDRELADIGVARSDIKAIAREAAGLE